MHNAKFKFRQLVLEKWCKNFEFLIIIDFYLLFFKEEMYKSFIHNAKLIFM